MLKNTDDTKAFKDKEKIISNLIAIALKLENAKESIEYIIQNFDYDEDVAYVLLRLGYAYFDAPNNLSALTVSSYLIEHYPKFFSGYVLHANVLERMERYSDAIKTLETLTALRKNAKPWLMLCRLLEKTNQSKEALDEYDLLVTAFPKDKDALFAYAMALAHNNNPKWEEIFCDLIDQYPNHWNARYCWGIFLSEKLEEYDLSIKELQEALRVLPEGFPKKANPLDEARILTSLGITYGNKMDLKKAKKVLQQAIETDPSYAAAYSALEKLRMKGDHYHQVRNDGNIKVKNHPGITQKVSLNQRYEMVRITDENRWNRLHFAPSAKNFSSLVNLEETSSTEIPRTASPIDINPSLKTVPKTKKLFILSKERLEVLDKIRGEAEVDFGKMFSDWFDLKFVKEVNGVYGILTQAIRQAEINLYPKALEHIQNIIHQTLSKINEYKLVLEEQKISEAINKNKDNETSTSIENSHDFSTIYDEIVSSKLVEESQILTNTDVSNEMNSPIGSLKEKSNNLFAQSSNDYFSFFKKFWYRVKQCCPPIGNAYGDEQEDNTKLKKIV